MKNLLFYFGINGGGAGKLYPPPTANKYGKSIISYLSELSKQGGRAMTEAEVCQERHKRIDEKLDIHDKRLNSHSEEIDRLNVSDARNTNEITNLCKQISDLVTTLRWLIGLLVTTLGGFFIWAIQTKLF